jgi:hypothetical protein
MQINEIFEVRKEYSSEQGFGVKVLIIFPVANPINCSAKF